ncbi:prenyltransferase [Patescibacteria group bacterium]|nr:prenyltransferase [Patescibacteria group bacterium]
MSVLTLPRALSLSRPRFWIYELGTFALGVLMALSATTTTPWWLVIIFALYFLYPANFLIYGVNDVYDYDTDIRNPKKAGYEDVLDPSLHRPVLRAIFWSTLPFLILAIFASKAALLAFIAFLFFAIGYSMPPVRAKARPLLDSFFSAGHYVATGVFGYYLAGEVEDVLLPVVAGMFWAMAMHAYSAVPDIAADGEAGVPTIATFLGKERTIIVCAFAYLGAGLIAYLYFGLLALALSVPYLIMMGLSLKASDERLLQLYKYFPKLNSVMGTLVTLLVLYENGWF